MKRVIYLRTSGHFVGIIRRGTSQQLSQGIASKLHARDLMIQKHSQRNGWVDMSAANTANQEDNKRQSSTDDQWIATAGKDRQNEKERTSVFCKVGQQRNIHFYYKLHNLFIHIPDSSILEGVPDSFNGAAICFRLICDRSFENG